MSSRKQNIKKINYRLKFDFIISYVDCRSYESRNHLVNISYTLFIAASMRCLIVIVISIAEASVTFQQRDLTEEKREIGRGCGCFYLEKATLFGATWRKSGTHFIGNRSIN